MRIRVAHVSLEFGDTDKEHTSDIEKIFDRAVSRKQAWVMGTESGPGAGNTGKELLRIGKAHGYRMWVPSEQGTGKAKGTDCWIAVRSDLVKSGWKTGYVPVIPGSQELYKEAGLDVKLPKWGPKGLVTVEFKSLPQIGEVNLVATHHLTKGQVKGPGSVINGVDHYEWNIKLDEAIAKHVGEQSKGSALSFGSMDRNASDRRSVITIEGVDTLADELKKWQNTGHGDIDWMFSVSKDGRVSGQNFTVLDDRVFPLNTDHFYLEGVYNIEALKI